ncbi:hypothetical protein PWT90_00257 [Aphanocladium album]|nr:hypothetical protein PWT90_00257 [Aphanocladium album]
MNYSSSIAEGKTLEPVAQVEDVKTHQQMFSADEERKLVRKLDLWILPLMMITYTLQSYDKGVMSAATQFGFNDDLHLTKVIGHDTAGRPITDNKRYANASMMFYIGYLVGTYPMMFLSQRFSISNVISGATCLWGAVLMSTAGCYNYSGIMVNRFFLGFLESAVAPAFTVLVTFWWTREEQALRMSTWYCCVGVATAISPLINYGLGQIHGPLLPWKPIFLILGAVTVSWSIVLFFFLPDNPVVSGRLSEREREIAIERLRRNNAGTVDHNFNFNQFKEALCDYKLYSGAFIVMLTGVPSGALGTFGTIVINGFGFNHFESLALTCPIGVMTALSILTVGFITRKLRNTRYISIAACGLISIAGDLVASGGLAVGLAASNTSGHTKKSTVSASTFVGYCVGNIIGPVIFGASPGPLYRAGFLGSFVCLCGVVVTAAATAVALRWENARRIRSTDTARHAQSIDEDLTDIQNKDFRYVL